MRNINTYLTMIFLLIIGLANAQNVSVTATQGAPSASYPTLKQAIDSINTGFFRGDIVITVNSSTTETATSRLDSSGISTGANYTSLLIRPADTATAEKVISYGVNGGVLLDLNGSDNIIIDGRPLGLGANRLLAFSHTNPNNSATSTTIRVINGVRNLLVRYCRINSATTAGTTANNPNISLSTSAATIGNRNIQFLYNTITGGVTGISAIGTLANFMDSVRICFNTISNAQSSSLNMNAVKTAEIDSNVISHTSIFSGWNVFGLFITLNADGSSYEVRRNRIQNLQSSTTTAQIIGVIISPANAAPLQVPKLNFINNAITLTATNAPIAQLRGVQFQGTTNPAEVSILYNTIRLGGSGSGTTGNPATMGLWKSNTSTSGIFRCFNNLFINTRTGATNSAIGYWNQTPTAGINSSDFNTVWGVGAFQLAWGGFLYNSEANWKTAAAPNEQNSVIGNVTFNAALEPTFNPGVNSARLMVGSASLPLSVTQDIYGTTRSLNYPYKGAFEALTPPDTNDASVIIMYTFGKIPTGTADTIRALIRNNGAKDLSNLDITLTGTLQAFSGTLTLPSLPRFRDTIINVTPYTPFILGFDTMRVSVPQDQNNTNNVVQWIRENTLNALSYTQTGQAQAGNVGTNPEGEIVAKFTTPVPNFVNQVNVNFTNGAFTSWPFQVVIYPDSGGINGPSRTPIYVSATQNTVNGIFNLTVPSVPVSGSFYLGVRQTTANNIGFAYQNENPIRNRTFYFRQGTGYATAVWNDFAVNAANQFRFMIEPRLKINDDLGVIDLFAPSSASCVTNPSQPIVVRVQNLGLLQQNFNVNPLIVRGTATRPSGTVVNLGPVTVNTGSLSSDSLLNVTLLSNFNMDTAGVYTFRAWTSFALDNNPVNDTLPQLTRSISVPAVVPVVEDLNGTVLPAAWTSNRFFLSTGTGVQNSNSARVALSNASPFNANAILFSPQISGITANTRLRFEYRIIDNIGGAPTILGNLDSINIYVSTDCGNNYTLIRTLSGSAHTPSAGYATLDVPLSAYASNTVRIKIQCDWLGTTNNAIVDIDNIRILNITNDVAVTSSSSPCRFVLAGTTGIIPTATLVNSGSTAQTSLNITYLVTGPAAYTGAASVASIAASQTASVNFTPAFNAATAGTYNVKVYSNLATDNDRFNDTLYYTFDVVTANATNASNSMNFNGAAFAVSPHNPSVNVAGNNLTLEAWINRTANVFGNRIIISRDSTLGFGQFNLLLNDSSNLIFNVTSVSTFDQVISSTQVPAATWTHVAATYDGTFMRIYINGELVGSSNLVNGPIISRQAPLSIGSRMFQVAGDFNRFNGLIDEVKVWNTTRTPTQIRNGMHVRLSNSGNANLVAYYRFDEGTGSVSFDASGNCNTVTITNPIWSTASYPLGSPVVSSQFINASGNTVFGTTGLQMNFTGFSGNDTIVVNRFAGAPLGISPIANPGGVTALHQNYWVAYRYGNGTFTDNNLLFTLGSGNLLSGVTNNDLVLFTRANGGTGAWTIQNASATASSFAGQSVTFAQTNGTFYGRQLAIGGNNNPLPVDLLQFNAMLQNKDVLLNWITANEQNNKGFEIERSANGKEFQTIGFVNGRNNSTEKTNYQYTDEGAFAQAQVLYYRLKQLDFDGKFSYSDVIRVQSGNALLNGVSVSPNPFTANAQVQLNTLFNASARITICDVQGRVVLNDVHEVSAGNNLINMQNMESLKQGVYFMRVDLGGESMVIKMVKSAQ